MALYDTIGEGYAALRRPDPRIAAAIETALGDAESVLNVGAGAGSYEPARRTVAAVDPSEVMIRQRLPGAAPCVQGYAEALPFGTASVDAAMAILTLHHWSDVERGLAEMARVARKRVVILTWVPDVGRYWLTSDYFPEILANDLAIFPGEDSLVALLARSLGRVDITAVPIPHDCFDGFLCAYWRRPELLLKTDVRAAISSFSRIDPEEGLAKLRADLDDGRWAERNRAIIDLDAIDLGYRLACCEIG